MFGRCKHEYKILDKLETKSEIEIIKAMGYKPNPLFSFEKKYQTILTCPKCGKLKIITLTI
jgi:hypothetical protein